MLTAGAQLTQTSLPFRYYAHFVHYESVVSTKICKPPFRVVIFLFGHWTQRHNCRGTIVPKPVMLTAGVSLVRARSFRYYVCGYESPHLHQNTAECNFCGVFSLRSISSLKVYVISGSCILFCNLLAISMGCFFTFTAK